ncbi:ABC transporter permease subunit [Halorubellus sp. PRR65]|uniref:ABC transporter permease n=1 Tax=Halorubellus sp. PRR65 TaxID=3098148 RepID=UPI002B260758|nr:ABC transporter permease subunit [Halorubellus sp. PRR65]
MTDGGRAIARTDLRIAKRSKGVWATVALFVLTFGGLAYALASLSTPSVDGYLDTATTVLSLLAPLVGVLFGYQTVVAERETGTIALALSLPHARRDVVTGKLAARALVLTTAITTGAITGLFVLYLRYPTLPLGRYLALCAGTLAYTLAFLALGTAFSTSIRTSRRVIGATFGSYIALVMLWSNLVDVVVLLLFRFRVEPGSFPLWAETLKFATPRPLYTYLLADTVDIGTGPPGLVADTQWFATPAIAAIILLAWLTIPPLLAYTHFRTQEL